MKNLFKNIFQSNNSNGIDKIKNKINSFGFENPENIIDLIKPAITIIEKKSESNLRLGESKIGGKPDLDKEKSWPLFEGKPMVFIGQINLEELARISKLKNFPIDGILSFFIYFDEPTNEFGSEYEFHPNKFKYKVIFTEDLTKIKNIDFPKELFNKFHFKPSSLDFQLNFQLPNTFESGFIYNLKLLEVLMVILALKKKTY